MFDRSTLKRVSSSTVVRVVASPSAEEEEGKEVTLTCVATRGSEKGSVYTWFKNDKWLKEDLKGNTLTFHRVSAQDAGFYYCRVHNTQGSSMSPLVTLRVLCKFNLAPFPIQTQEVTHGAIFRY